MKQYTTERGIKIGIMPIPLLLDKIREAHGGPAVPTYTEQVAGGEQEVELDAKMMAAAKEHNTEWYNEHREAWEAYQELGAASETVLNQKLLDAISLKAVRVDMPKDDEWIEEQEFLGLDVPTSPAAQRAHFVQTEVMGGSDDMLRILAIASGAEVSEEVLAQASDSFRGYLQENLAEGLEDQIRSMGSE